MLDHCATRMDESLELELLLSALLRFFHLDVGADSFLLLANRSGPGWPIHRLRNARLRGSGVARATARSFQITGDEIRVGGICGFAYAPPVTMPNVGVRAGVRPCFIASRWTEGFLVEIPRPRPRPRKAAPQHSLICLGRAIKTPSGMNPRMSRVGVFKRRDLHYSRNLRERLVLAGTAPDQIRYRKFLFHGWEEVGRDC